MPSIPSRLDALEAALALEQARRLALLVALHDRLTRGPAGGRLEDFVAEPGSYDDLKDFLEARIAEGP